MRQLASLQTLSENVPPTVACRRVLGDEGDLERRLLLLERAVFAPDDGFGYFTPSGGGSSVLNL